MVYTLDVPFIKKTGQVIGILEYSIDDKWYRPKKKIGTYQHPLTDDDLNTFIEEICPDEVCLLIKDKKDNERRIDFGLADLELETDDYEEDDDEDVDDEEFDDEE